MCIYCTRIWIMFCIFVGEIWRRLNHSRPSSPPVQTGMSLRNAPESKSVFVSIYTPELLFNHCCVLPTQLHYAYSRTLLSPLVQHHGPRAKQKTQSEFYISLLRQKGFVVGARSQTIPILSLRCHKGARWHNLRLICVLTCCHNVLWTMYVLYTPGTVC